MLALRADDTVPAGLRSAFGRWDTSGTPVRRLTRGDRGRGATAVEYALMALVIAVIVVLVATVGRQVFDLYHTVPIF